MKRCKNSVSFIQKRALCATVRITGMALLAVGLCFGLSSSTARADASRAFSWGDQRFGADGSYDYVDWANGDWFKGSFRARADVTVLGKRLPAGAGEVNVEVRRPSNCRTTGFVKLGGSTVASWDRSFTGSTTFTTPPFWQTQIGGQATFPIGPVSLTIKANAEVKAYVRGSVGVTYSSSTGRPIVSTSAGPAMDAAASAAAELDAWLASAGVEAALTLTGYGINGNLTYMPRSSGNPTVAYSVTANTQSTDGTIKGYVKVGRGFLSKKWSKTFFEYHGGPSSTTITSGSRQL